MYTFLSINNKPNLSATPAEPVDSGEQKQPQPLRAGLAGSSGQQLSPLFEEAGEPGQMPVQVCHLGTRGKAQY